MPHIIVTSEDKDRCMQEMNIHVELKFRPDFYQQHSNRVIAIYNEIEAKLYELVESYNLDPDASQTLSNHEFNKWELWPNH